MAPAFRLAGAPSRPRTVLILSMTLGLLIASLHFTGLTHGFRRHGTAVLGHVEVVAADDGQAVASLGVEDSAAGDSEFADPVTAEPESAAGQGEEGYDQAQEAAAAVDTAAAEAGDAGTAEQAPADVPPEIQQRCRGTLGDWCTSYLMQQPIPAKAPPTGNRTCLWGCNFVGVCDHMAGWCRCPAGWTGDDCSTRMKRPCSQRPRSHGFEPFNEPTDLTKGKGVNAGCASLCDEDIGYCFCNSSMAYGHELAPPDAPPGTPPVKRGRPLGFHCQPNKDNAGNSIHFGDQDPADLFGPKGWCQAAVPKIRCPCILDGYCGDTCDQYCEQFCPNQCSGHGECNMGFCKCHEGWWGHDCAYRRSANMTWSPGMEAGERPWLELVVDTPAAKDPEPGQTRLRPLIYVYELPAIFNSVMLQYRPDRGTCVHRLFNQDNSTRYIDDWGYVAETALHEALLQSKHRTLDPEEADFFYMPVYSSCYIYPIHGFNDFPFFHAFHNIPRVHATVNMLIEAQAWVRSHHPYWDRNGGRDHIVLMTHDEGSCWLPAVLRPAIMMTHWGRMDSGHISMTGFAPDNYTVDSSHPVYMPEGHAGKLGDFPCYNPEKDLVIPPMNSAHKYAASPLVGAPARQKDMLAFFKGRTQQENTAYSRGIRQKLENLCRDEGWWEKHRIWLGEAMPPNATGSYSEMLASATFCFALPGDGFSPRFEDAMHHGCIPVIIQDEVHLGFESILDMPSFTVRIAEKDMERVPEILRAISQEEVAAKQEALVAVWRRYAYTGFKQYADVTRGFLGRFEESKAQETPESRPVLKEKYDPEQDDAMATIYAWLYSRIPHTRGPVAPGAGGGTAAAGGGGQQKQQRQQQEEQQQGEGQGSDAVGEQPQQKKQKQQQKGKKKKQQGKGGGAANGTSEAA